MTPAFLISCRDDDGLEVDTLGPFKHVIVRPGSNWAEVQDFEHDWQTISTASYKRLLMKIIDLEEHLADEERNRRVFADPW